MKFIESSSLNKMRVSSLNNGHLIFDIFLLNNHLHIVGPATPNFDIDSLSVYYNNSELFIKKYMYDFKGIEGFFFLIYECYGESNITIDVNYKDDSKSFNISNEIVKEEFIHKLSITTLCFKDYELFPMWHEYYKKQGVDHFYMYYNGKLTQEIVDIFDKNDVTLIEWDFNYWVYTKIRRHFAQIGQIQHSLYKYGKTNSEYMIYCDLDEYFHINNSTIKETIKNKIVDHLYFLNIWCKTLDGRIPRSFPENFYCNIKPDKYPIRSKNIYKTSMFNYLFIHCPNLNNYPRFRNKYNKSIINNKRIGYLGGILFHFGNWFGRKRPLCDRQSKYPRDKDKIIKLLGLQK
jgi:hypothetical protein